MTEQSQQIVSDDPYENQLLGRFIAELSYRAGETGKPRPKVDLFQQTPLDQTFGDLLIQTGAFFALEFKRHYEGPLQEELEKWNPDCLLDMLNASYDWTLPIGTTGWDFSSKAHLLVSGKKGHPDDVIVRDYMPAVLANYTEQCPRATEKEKSLTVFADRLLTPRIFISAGQMYEYLSRLRDCRKTEGSSSRRKGTSMVAAILADSNVAVITKEVFFIFCKLCILANKSLPMAVSWGQSTTRGHRP